METSGLGRGVGRTPTPRGKRDVAKNPKQKRGGWNLVGWVPCFKSLPLFPAGGPSFASKPTTPTGMGGGFPPSPQKPPPQPMGGSGWQQGTGYGWQGTQPKGQPSAPHASPQNKPNYNVSFSTAGPQGERGKGAANVGKRWGIRHPEGWISPVVALVPCRGWFGFLKFSSRGIFCEQEKCFCICTYVIHSFSQEGLLDVPLV